MNSIATTCWSKINGLDWIGPLRLCPQEVRRIPAGVPGVYLLHSYASRIGAYPVFYAGRSTDLRRRLLQHLDPARAKSAISGAQHIACPYFSAAPVLDPLSAAAIESWLIRWLQPVCNDQVPAVIPLPVDLPPLWASMP